MQATGAKTTETNVVPVFNGKATAAVFNYEDEIRQLWQMFPDMRESIYFVDLATRRGLYPGSRVIEHGLTAWLKDDEGLQHLIEKYREVEKSSCCVPVGDKRCILLYTEDAPQSMWRRFMPLAQMTSFVFDHEIAHAVIADASGKVDPSLAECIADAYATIRHFQRYGADSTTIDGLAEMRAARFVFANLGNSRGKIHFTSPVVEQLLARRHDIDWNKLNPEETAGLARRFGLMYAPHPILLERFEECFRACRTQKDTQPKGDETNLGTLARILEAATFPAFVKYGSMALKFFAPEAEGLPELKQARARIARRAELLENMDEIFLGLEGKTRKAATRPQPMVIANQP